MYNNSLLSSIANTLPGALPDWPLLPLPLPPPRLHGGLGLPLVLMVRADSSGTLMTSGILVILSVIISHSFEDYQFDINGISVYRYRIPVNSINLILVKQLH